MMYPVDHNRNAAMIRDAMRRLGFEPVDVDHAIYYAAKVGPIGDEDESAWATRVAKELAPRVIQKTVNSAEHYCRTFCEDRKALAARVQAMHSSMDHHVATETSKLRAKLAEAEKQRDAALAAQNDAASMKQRVEPEPEAPESDICKECNSGIRICRCDRPRPDPSGDGANARISRPSVIRDGRERAVPGADGGEQRDGGEPTSGDERERPSDSSGLELAQSGLPRVTSAADGEWRHEAATAQAKLAEAEKQRDAAIADAEASGRLVENLTRERDQLAMRKHERDARLPHRFDQMRMALRELSDAACGVLLAHQHVDGIRGSDIDALRRWSINANDVLRLVADDANRSGLPPYTDDQKAELARAVPPIPVDESRIRRLASNIRSSGVIDESRVVESQIPDSARKELRAFVNQHGGEPDGQTRAIVIMARAFLGES